MRCDVVVVVVVIRMVVFVVVRQSVRELRSFESNRTYYSTQEHLRMRSNVYAGCLYYGRG